MRTAACRDFHDEATLIRLTLLSVQLEVGALTASVNNPAVSNRSYRTVGCEGFVVSIYWPSYSPRRPEYNLKLQVSRSYAGETTRPQGAYKINEHALADNDVTSRTCHSKDMYVTYIVIRLYGNCNRFFSYSVMVQAHHCLKIISNSSIPSGKCCNAAFNNPRLYVHVFFFIQLSPVYRKTKYVMKSTKEAIVQADWCATSVTEKQYIDASDVRKCSAFVGLCFTNISDGS